MSALYIVRFDDICQEMNWGIWDEIEKILDNYQIKPIVAVVPSNADPFLKINKPKSDFWKRVKIWQEKGWAIGLHGFTHVYETRNPGIVGLNRRSEFAGLPLGVQQNKIDSAVKIFKENNINIDVWVAPAHSFDDNTILALNARGINVVSDGYFRRAVNINGTIWVPQQLWRFKPKNSGLWTVCYHHNSWSDSDIKKFESDIKLFRDQIIKLKHVSLSENECVITIRDRLQALLWLKKIILLRFLEKSFVGRIASSPFLRLILKLVF